MTWIVEFHSEFEAEFDELDEAVQDELLARAKLLELVGPTLGRPNVDTPKGSKYSNMKELRFDVNNGVWRVAFIFDRERKGILLFAANKTGVPQQRFYKTLLRIADERFTAHLHSLIEEE